MSVSRILSAAAVIAGAVCANPAMAKGSPPAEKPTAAAAQDESAIQETLHQPGDSVVAVVNDDMISDYDLRQRILLFLATSGLRATAENLKNIRQQVLSQLETERLEILEAHKKKISVSTAEVDRAINNILQDNHLTLEQIKKLFETNGVDMSTFRSQLAAQIAWSKTVQNEYGDRVNVSQQDVDAQMRQLAAGANKPHFRVAEIFEAVDSPEQDPQVLKNMQSLLEQLRAGAPFEAVARQFSQNPTAASGGDLGVVQQGQLVPELDAALQKMRPGEVAGPIKASGGYYLLALRARQEPAGTKVPDPSEQQANVDPNVLPLARVLLPIGPKPPKALLENATKAAFVVRERIAGCEQLQELVGRLKGAMYFNLGKMQLNTLSPEIREALSKTHPGETTEPFRSAAGIELIVRCDKAAPKIEVFKLPTKDDVEQQLYAEQMAVYARRYLRDLRRVANIETAEERGLKRGKSSATAIR